MRARPAEMRCPEPWTCTLSSPSGCATGRTRTRPPRSTGCPERRPPADRSPTAPNPLQGKALSYNNLLDAAAAAALARDLRGAAVVIVKHGNPCGAAEAPDLLSAWEAALAGDPVSAFGGVAAVRGTVDAGLAECLASLFLEVVVAASFEPGALALLAGKPDLRLLADPSILVPPVVTVELRTAGGGVLATESDSLPDDPATWRPVTARAPSSSELEDLDFAWRVCRRVASNAIVLVRDRARGGRRSRTDEPGGQRPPRGRQGGTGARPRRRLRLGRLLPVPRRARGLRRGRSHRLRTARRLQA